jgi:uncharacterized repeat protein (TIGR01451 family)
MKKQTVLKKLLSSILVSIIVLGQFSSYRFISEAATINGGDGPIYLSLSKTNEDAGNPIGYANSKEQFIYNIVSSDSVGNNRVSTSNLYCIKAAYGETWGKNPLGMVAYNWSSEFSKDTGTTPSEVVNRLTEANGENLENLNEVLWLLDNMYVPGESDKIEFLEQADIYFDDGTGVYEYIARNGHDYYELSGVDSAYAYTLTEDDIIAIQQSALWYFTNKEQDIYNLRNMGEWLKYTTDGVQYKAFNTNDGEEVARRAHAYVLYNYLIDEAEEETAALEDGKYELKNTIATLWLSVSTGETIADNKEQPVVEIHKKPDEPEEPEKIFDLSLRKTIVDVKDSEGNSKQKIENTDGNDATRIITVDSTPLILDGEKTTANYNHRKDPVVVETGDTVTYAITIYNEGEQDGYATVINDKLPGTWDKGLRLISNSGTVTAKRGEQDGNTYKVEYKSETNTVVLTMLEESSANQRKVLEAYDGEGIPESETVYIECKVMGNPDSSTSKILTNIAYIAQDYNAETSETNDRDSKPAEYPQVENLITNDIGYIGNETANTNKDLSKNVYFEGQQDDDDFEKVVILPVSFDLSLRKNITKVNGEAVSTRTPDIKTDTLKNGETTAEYNHRKDAVAVKNGDIVEYNITTYNEGSIDGVASIIKDQLPTSLAFDLAQFAKDGNEYIVTSSKGNQYAVTYDKTNNIVTFTLKESSIENIKLLAAYTNRDKLDQDVITLQCKVECKADDNTNIYLTNIAYINTAIRYDGTENGTIVTNQKAGTENGSEADRDSEPYTIPNEKAEDLKTIGNVGYIGDETANSNKDLSQNVYFKGEQDDDDFEKLVILPEAFDLSLRKYITEVDGVEVENTRKPEINTTNLENGQSTTAEYKHRKDPVTVENGSKVTYNISIYNEGAKAGIATIVRDQLPTGLKLNLNNIEYFEKEGEKYFVTSSKGNVYEVIYSEETNLVEFRIDKTETKTLTYLKEYKLGAQKLDEEIISIQCLVNHVADNEENIYFTNVAYIYTAEQIDGTVVTNQEPASGANSDIDSTPYVHPTPDELTTVGNVGYTGHKDNANKNLSQNIYFKGEQDDDDFEKLVMLPKTFDLKLIKFITQVNDETTGNRVISLDTSKLNTTDSETTAEYILEKNPVSVKAGDFVTYTLRIYNEGHYDGYATEISENIPEGLEFIVVGQTGEEEIYWSWNTNKELKDITEEIKNSEMHEEIKEINSNWGYDKESSIITTRALSEDIIKGFGQENVQYADSENKIDYKEVQVIFRVEQDVEPNVIIRNEASISQDKAVDEQGKELTDINDRDSKPEEWKKENSEESYDEKGKWPIYKEDDEDYDNIVTKAFDLSLRKQIIQINNGLYTGRYATLLENKEEQENTKTLYNYYDVYSSKPKVKAGDKVTYSIRVYNEGDIDGYASLIVDTLPSGLEFVEYEPGDGSINDKYGWILVEGTENVYQTDYLSYEKDVNRGTSRSTLLKAYDGEGEASYQEIYIECKVKEDVTKQDSLLNVAQIADDSDEKGNPITDKDSVPGTSDDESKWKVEDDLDIEILQLQEFDLALRKFITQIENGENIKDVTTRIPKVSYDKEKGQLVYTHPKDALVVHVGDTVIYTLRVYNEGDIDGYASEIKDDIPEYLEYLPEHTTNKEYEWAMYDKEGKITENVEEAVFIKTEHLAKGKGVEVDKESKETNLIKAFDPEAEVSDKNPDFKEIKVAFKVKDPNSTEYEIVNFAQISDDTDSKGEPIKDRDSEPDNGKDEPKEDDEDIEKVKVEYFDLSLLKYVTKVLVNENGAERTIETGNVGDENDIIPHVQINKKNIDKTVVKFVYTIQITNEGQIAGEATEITDYVPEGLVFVAEDNELWTDEGNNVISTRQLKGTTLQPGETAQVEVTLRWINGSDNLGPKTNVAEISEDHNEENVPDRDSIPDNKKEGEDDIDDATVLLSVNQGGGIQSIYINLTMTFLVIILIGGVLIKKFVL